MIPWYIHISLKFFIRFILYFHVLQSMQQSLNTFSLASSYSSLQLNLFSNFFNLNIFASFFNQLEWFQKEFEFFWKYPKVSLWLSSLDAICYWIRMPSNFRNAKERKTIFFNACNTTYDRLFFLFYLLNQVFSKDYLMFHNTSYACFFFPFLLFIYLLRLSEKILAEKRR